MIHTQNDFFVAPVNFGVTERPPCHLHSFTGCGPSDGTHQPVASSQFDFRSDVGQAQSVSKFVDAAFEKYFVMKARCDLSVERNGSRQVGVIQDRPTTIF